MELPVLSVSRQLSIWILKFVTSKFVQTLIYTYLLFSPPLLHVLGYNLVGSLEGSVSACIYYYFIHMALCSHHALFGITWIS